MRGMIQSTQLGTRPCIYRRAVPWRCCYPTRTSPARTTFVAAVMRSLIIYTPSSISVASAAAERDLAVVEPT